MFTRPLPSLRKLSSTDVLIINNNNGHFEGPTGTGPPRLHMDTHTHTQTRAQSRAHTHTQTRPPAQSRTHTHTCAQRATYVIIHTAAATPSQTKKVTEDHREDIIIAWHITPHLQHPPPPRLTSPPATSHHQSFPSECQRPIIINSKQLPKTRLFPLQIN